MSIIKESYLPNCMVGVMFLELDQGNSVRGIRIPYEFYYNSDYEKPGINKKSLFLDVDDWIESGVWKVKFFQKSEGIQAFSFRLFPQKVKIEPMKNVKEYKAYEK